MFTAVDIEVATEFREDWRAQRPLGITCAATVTDDQPTRLWYAGLCDDGRRASRMNPSEALSLLHYLAQRTLEGDVVVGWNSCAFDLDVIGKEAGAPALAAALALSHVDMAFQMLCEMGYMAGLGAVAKGMGLAEKLMHGEDAPLRWRGTREDQDAVLAYVAGDAELTAQVYRAVVKDHNLFWVTKSGARKVWQPTLVRGRMLTVVEANSLPTPDTSWMTRPRSRAGCFAWAIQTLGNEP